MHSVLERILKARHALLTDNEEPRDLLIGVDLRNELRRALDPLMMYHCTAEAENLMGMRIEWKRPGTDISIRTVNGDLRRVP